MESRRRKPYDVDVLAHSVFFIMEISLHQIFYRSDFPILRYIFKRARVTTRRVLITARQCSIASPQKHREIIMADFLQ